MVSEPPCLSLADCTKPSLAAAEMGDEVTLAYPALVALRQAQRAASPQARGVIAAAKSSRVRVVARMAAVLEGRSSPAPAAPSSDGR
ncbi:MAG: hypothetical protein A2V88_14435 [Elusimicrobia bacterium RBG_16_66_12]|nr:MAG: hypothetical protein A2V88_14435 [Elusimicrobia bacterium RBG_16_66_12]